MKYNVHFYPICRVKVPDVEAENKADAIRKAMVILEKQGLNRIVKQPEFDFADAFDGCLVDEGNDPEFKKTKFYEAGEMDDILEGIDK